ncbi:hypothetical protein IKH83_00010 [Candidatus Saccharibacteria bacterium]|nr:hypothetical protein [Candidatus Saccharibacteria bacterium]
MKNFSKIVLGTVVAAATAGTIAPVANVSAWGDTEGGRKGYTLEEIDAGVLGDKIVFNSIIDATTTDENGTVLSLGDERNFVRARLSGSSDFWSTDEITVEDGKEYVISLYVHNNNPKGEDAVAENVAVQISIPKDESGSIEVNGFIDSSNATPGEYWDNIIFKSADGSKFHLEYVDGSAAWSSNGASNGALSDDIVRTIEGVKVGYDKLDGKIPGCYQYSGYASVRVKAVFEHEPEDTPKTIVKTGADSIVVSALGAGAVVTALGYYIASRKQLR